VAAHVLHGHEVLFVDLTQLEDLHDVRVAQLGRDLGLIDEHLGERGVAGKVRQNALDDKGPLEPGWALDARLEHVGHASPPDAFEERVFAECDRLLKRYTHDFTVDFISKYPCSARSRVTFDPGELRLEVENKLPASSVPVQVFRRQQTNEVASEHTSAYL
jgi:hypothetical protein